MSGSYPCTCPIGCTVRRWRPVDETSRHEAGKHTGWYSSSTWTCRTGTPRSQSNTRITRTLESHSHQTAASTVHAVDDNDLFASDPKPRRLASLRGFSAGLLAFRQASHVPPVGLEPTTYGLKVHSSTN